MFFTARRVLGQVEPVGRDTKDTDYLRRLPAPRRPQVRRRGPPGVRVSRNSWPELKERREGCPQGRTGVLCRVKGKRHPTVSTDADVGEVGRTSGFGAWTTLTTMRW